MFMYATGANISRLARPICFFSTTYYKDTVPFGGMGHVSSRVCGCEQGLWTDQRWDASVGVGGGKPGSTATAWHSLDVDHPLTSSRPKGGSTKQQRGGLSRREERRGMTAVCFWGQAAAGKPGTECLNNFRNPTASLDLAIATGHYSLASHYR
jgi:hypothetical protein